MDGSSRPSARMSRSGFFSRSTNWWLAFYDAGWETTVPRARDPVSGRRARAARLDGRSLDPPRAAPPRRVRRLPRPPGAPPPRPLPQGLRRRDVFVVGRLLRRRGRAAPRRSPARLAARSRRAACARSRSRSIVLASSASGTDAPSEALRRTTPSPPSRRRPRPRSRPRPRPRAPAPAPAPSTPPRRHGPGRGGARRSCA